MAENPGACALLCLTSDAPHARGPQTTVHLSFQSVASLMVDLQTAIVANLFRGDGLRKVTVDIMFTEELIVRTRQAHPRAAADTGLPRELTSRAGRCHPWEPPHDVFKMEPRVFKSQCLAKCIKLERYDMPFRSCRSWYVFLAWAASG